eukprot:Em0027g7a
MMLDSAGIYTGDEDASDQDLLVVERKTFKSLCSGLVQQCGCLSNPSWTIASFIKYMNFALFAGMGVVKQKYISSGLNIPEVAHDYQATIKQCVQQLGMVNSYDTWHGTKNVAKQLRHICAGTVRTRDRTWFTELSDKACTKVHLYWCMRNCGGNPDRLRAMIMNISKHFQDQPNSWHWVHWSGVCRPQLQGLLHQPGDTAHPRWQDRVAVRRSGMVKLSELACCSVSDPHAVSWLSVVLSIGLGLEPNEYQMSIRWWLAKAVYCNGDEKGGLGNTTAKAQGCQ